MNKLKFGESNPLSHAYIVSSLSEEARRRTEDILAVAAVCSASEGKPCGVCRDCRKAASGNHPDIIHVRRELNDSGKRKKEIVVDQIRNMISEAQIMPNEANGKAFVIHEAELMNVQAQNTLLKLLEEPPAGVVLILSSSTPSMLLQTVRSRCIELTENDAAPELDEETKQLVRKYLSLVAKGKKSGLLAWCNQTAGKMDIAGAMAFTDAVKRVITDILCGREKDCGLTKAAYWFILELMDRCETYLNVNTGVKHIFGLIAVNSIG